MGHTQTAPPAPPAPPARRFVPLLLWVVALAVALALFHLLGRGPLAAPSLTDPDGWGVWAARRDAVTVVFALLRLVVLATGWYLLGITTVGLAARLARAARLVQLADALTVPWVRRLLQAALGLGLATAATTLAASPHEPGSVHRILVAADSHGSVAQVLGTDSVHTPRARGARGTAAMAAVPAGGPSAAMTAVPAGGPTAAMRQLPPDPAAPQPRTWTAARGQHFWAIADHVVTEAWARPPTDAELVPYWRQLVETNRDALADPANPDLIYPGQVFEVPPPPPPPPA